MSRGPRRPPCRSTSPSRCDRPKPAEPFGAPHSSEHDPPKRATPFGAAHPASPSPAEAGAGHGAARRTGEPVGGATDREAGRPIGSTEPPAFRQPSRRSPPPERWSVPSPATGTLRAATPAPRYATAGRTAEATPSDGGGRRLIVERLARPGDTSTRKPDADTDRRRRGSMRSGRPGPKTGRARVRRPSRPASGDGSASTSVPGIGHPKATGSGEPRHQRPTGRPPRRRRAPTTARRTGRASSSDGRRRTSRVRKHPDGFTASGHARRTPSEEGDRSDEHGVGVQ